MSYYGSQPSAPSPPGPVERPRTVEWACYLMLAGAVLSLAGIFSAFGATGRVRADLARRSPHLDPAQLDQLVNLTKIVAVVGGLATAGLWIWMAYANRAGWSWARIVGTVFFGVNTFGLVASQTAAAGLGVLGNGYTPFSVTTLVLRWAAGLGAVVLLWHRASRPYFSRPSGVPLREYPDPPYPKLPPVSPAPPDPEPGPDGGGGFAPPG